MVWKKILVTILIIIFIYLVSLGLGIMPYLFLPDPCQYPLFCDKNTKPYCVVELNYKLFSFCPMIGIGLICLFGLASIVMIFILACILRAAAHSYLYDINMKLDKIQNYFSGGYNPTDNLI